MTRSTVILPGVLAALALSVGVSRAAKSVNPLPQCNANEVLVDEDENNYYCKDRSVYASCIKQAGESLRDSNPACARRYQQCFVDEKPGLTTAALGCALGCLGSKLSPARCLSTCGVAGIYPTRVVERCTDVADSCFGDALRAHRRRVDACKR